MTQRRRARIGVAHLARLDLQPIGLLLIALDAFARAIDIRQHVTTSSVSKLARALDARSELTRILQLTLRAHAGERKARARGAVARLASPVEESARGRRILRHAIVVHVAKSVVVAARWRSGFARTLIQLSPIDAAHLARSLLVRRRREWPNDGARR